MLYALLQTLKLTERQRARGTVSVLHALARKPLVLSIWELWLMTDGARKDTEG